MISSEGSDTVVGGDAERAAGMYTSGLVVTFADDPPMAASARLALAESPAVTLGESLGVRAAAALEVPTPQDARAWHDWAEAVPGVAGLEVVFVDWQDDEERSPHDQG